MQIANNDFTVHILNARRPKYIFPESDTRRKGIVSKIVRIGHGGSINVFIKVRQEITKSVRL